MAHDPLSRPGPSSGAEALDALDALRGVAILAVFAQHLGDTYLSLVLGELGPLVPAWLAPFAVATLEHAFWGVDLFFVLSGFSLAHGYLHALERGRPPSAARFLAQRATRILPGYFVALALVLAHRPFLVELPRFGAALASHLVLLQGYWAPGAIVFIGATWSLTTEAHFYLLFPLFARRMLERRGQRRGLALGVVLVVGAWATRHALHDVVLEPHRLTGLFELTQRRWILCRLDQFVLGAIAAALRLDLVGSPLRARAARLAPLALVGAALALVAAFRAEGALLLVRGGSWPYAFVSLATAALLFSATLVEGRLARALAPRWLRAVGVVSYGVFLYHQLAIGLTASWLGLIGRPPTLAALALHGPLALALSGAFGLGSWLVVEKPALAAVARRRARVC